SFLANSFDEALSGAIKLARFLANLQGRSPAGLVIDRAGRLNLFAGVDVSAGSGDPTRAMIEFIPKLMVADGDAIDLATLIGPGKRLGFVVLLVYPGSFADRDQQAIRKIVLKQKPLIITCVDRLGLDILRQSATGLLRDLVPDMVVFDESFVDG